MSVEIRSQVIRKCHWIPRVSALVVLLVMAFAVPIGPAFAAQSPAASSRDGSSWDSWILVLLGMMAERLNCSIQQLPPEVPVAMMVTADCYYTNGLPPMTLSERLEFLALLDEVEVAVNQAPPGFPKDVLKKFLDVIQDMRRGRRRCHEPEPIPNSTPTATVSSPARPTPPQARLQLVCRPFTRRGCPDLTGSPMSPCDATSGARTPVCSLSCGCAKLNISAIGCCSGGMPLFRSDQRKDPSHESVNRALETLGEHFRLLSEEISRAATIRPSEFASPESITQESKPVRSNTPIKRGKRAPSVQVRLLLGPANGRNLELRQPLPNRILVVLGEAGAVTAEPSQREAAQGEMVYRRVLDRSYRWVPSDR